MLILAYILGVLIGIVLGLFGAGGAIISFPVLVYFMNIAPEEAGLYSLIIVGIAALTGNINHFRNKNIDVKIAVIFSIPLLIGFYLTKFWLLPSIPNYLFNFSGFSFTKNHLILLIFIITLSYIIIKMLKKTSSDSNNLSITSDKHYIHSKNIIHYISYSALVGILAASIGAGGGFIIVPALMNIFNLSIKKATGTSLLIISINAFIGTLMNLQYFSAQYLIPVSIFSLLAISGIFIGTYLNKIITTANLKKSYAYFLMIVLISTVFSEIYKNNLIQ